MKKTLINWLGLLGIISLLSYTAMVVFAPLAYPGYDWKSQAVSDLGAANAPSLTLANQLNALFGPCGIVCVMMVCVAIQGRLNKTLRTGLYFFAAMIWVTIIGYTMFPLTESGYAATFQDFMHGADRKRLRGYVPGFYAWGCDCCGSGIVHCIPCIYHDRRVSQAPIPFPCRMCDGRSHRDVCWGNRGERRAAGVLRSFREVQPFCRDGLYGCSGDILILGQVRSTMTLDIYIFIIKAYFCGGLLYWKLLLPARSE